MYVHPCGGVYIKDTLGPQFMLSLQRFSQFERHFLPYRVILGRKGVFIKFLIFRGLQHTGSTVYIK